jgi:aspartate dehydrogenase
MRVAIIGYGAIGGVVHRTLVASGHEVSGIFLRKESASRGKPGLVGVTIVEELDAFLALPSDVVVECAGHEALRRHGVAILEKRRILVISSIGAMADRELESRLESAAGRGGRLVLPSGALAGLDALAAASQAGLEEVRYTSRKAPAAWKGTRAESLIDLAKVSSPQPFFEGTAREAALAFPQNANVAAAVALAGLGFDRTSVRLMVDPQAAGNQHLIEARGAFGEISARVLAHTSAENPKTSMLVPHSIMRSILNISSSVVI